MLDVLLVNPSNTLHQYGSNKDMVPIGMLWIAGTMEKAGYSVRILDLEFGQDNLEQALQEDKPRVVGIAGTSVSRFGAFQIAQLAKQVNPNVVTVYGGSHATFTAQDTMEHVPEIDIIVRGEGEESMLEIMQCLDAKSSEYSKILGISYRDNNLILHNEARPRIQDLDGIPTPARHLVDMDQYEMTLDLLNHKAASIITSRGCPINCSFCSASFMFGRTLTTRSAKNVVDEMEHVLTNYDVKGFKVFDSTFTLLRRHAESICDEIIARKLEFPWECEIRVNTVDPPLLEKMRKAGCYLVDFGIESASERVLKRMHKNINLDQVDQVLKWTNDLGISQRAFFTFGHIEETVEDAEITFNYIKERLNKISLLGIGVGIRIYPGTEVERYALSQGYLDGFSWSEPYSSPGNNILSLSENIPTLIQPQLGYEELHAINKKVLTLQARNPRFIIRRILKSHSKADFKRYVGIFKRLVRSWLSNKKKKTA